MNNRKMMTLAIILVAVIALSIGFAAYSARLTISSQAQVNPDAADFSVKFSKTEGVLDESNVVATNIVGEGVVAEEAEIDNTDVPTITNLNATFTSPNQSVTYEFYVLNESSYDAYIRDVNFEASVNGVDFISCEAGAGATDSLVQAACDGINFELTIGNQEYTPGANTVVQELVKGTSKKVVVKLSYEAGSALADGPFTVSIGDVGLTYASTSTGDYPIPEVPIEDENVVFDDVVTFTLQSNSNNKPQYLLDKKLNIDLNNYNYSLTIDDELQYDLISYFMNIDSAEYLVLNNHYESAYYVYYAIQSGAEQVGIQFYGKEFADLAGTHNVKLTKIAPVYPHLLRINQYGIEILSTEIEAVESIITVKDSQNNIVLTKTVTPETDGGGILFEISDSNPFNLLENGENLIVTITQGEETYTLGGSEYEYIFEESSGVSTIGNCIMDENYYYWGDNRKAIWYGGC